jgi:hypothetical protein
MKVDDFAYRVAARTIEILEHEQHYKVSEEHRKSVLDTIKKETNKLLKECS